MPDYLLDTGPLIRHLRNRKDATLLLTDLTRSGSLCMSVVSRMEIVQGMRDDQKQITYELFDSLQTLPIDADIADMAGRYLAQYRRDGITLYVPDALIAATAVVRSLVLVTHDRRGFPMPELRLVVLP